MLDYLPELLKGLHTSLTLTAASIVVALILSLVFTIVLTLKTPVLVWIVRAISPYLPVRRCWCRSS
jgi:arginine transport system permease protein